MCKYKKLVSIFCLKVYVATLPAVRKVNNFRATSIRFLKNIWTVLGMNIRTLKTDKN